MSQPKQTEQNRKNAARYFRLLIKSNFGRNDYHATLTYSPENMPASLEEAEKIVKNYVRRLKHLRKKRNLSPLKYILVTEQGTKSGKIHHHIIMNKGLSRDEVEALWRKRKAKGQTEGTPIGIVNADRLQLDKKGIDALATYLTKDPQGRRRWNPSQNLRKPEVSVSDTKTSGRQFHQLCLLPSDCEDIKKYFEKKYPGYELTECEKKLNPVTCAYSIYAKMRYAVKKAAGVKNIQAKLNKGKDPGSFSGGGDNICRSK